jgi:actin-like ATPase involved in cell morphogenesis
MKACGIDLGTTNSCIYVVTPEGPSLVLDDQKRKTFPSVVHIGRDGKASIGYAAKNRMGELPAPVATIKRKMGSNEMVTLGKERETPVQVSARILRFLKELATNQEHEEVDRAVVTVPAYFGHIQRQQTDQAAREAGFREVTTLLEPVAAALAYTLSSERERLRIFVYDLGGGTFDATVLEKDDQGGLNVLSFGGDPFLGGDDLDARLVQLLIEKLAAKGYKLDLNLDNPEDFSRFQRLKFYAEDAKIRLTAHESIEIVRQGLFQDQSGDLVDLDVTVTREELEQRTRDLIERSITESLATLTKNKNKIEISSIDEVIMVGGMSRMPLVARRLQEVFGKPPKLEDPDLIVARGAAIKAAQIYPERAAGAGGLTLDLRYDRQTDKRAVRVAGVFNRVLNDHTVYLIDSREDRYERLSGTDRFSFDGVVLVENQVNAFTLTVEDAAGETVLEQSLEIKQDPNCVPVLSSPGSVVTKAISVWTLDGPLKLFPENTALPHSATCKLQTADQVGEIALPIWEGAHQLEVLKIRGIPKDLAIGTPVVMEVSVEADYSIRAKASVPSIKQSVDITFRIEAVDTARMTPQYIAERLADFEEKARKAAADCPSPDEVETFWVLFRGTLKEIEMELTEAEPKRLKIQEKFGALAALIRGLSQRQDGIQLHPSFEEFNEKLSGIETGAIQAKHSKLPEVRPQIEKLRREAEAAWKARDRIAWSRANNQIEAIASALPPEWTSTEWAENLAAFIIGYQFKEIRKTGRAGRFESEMSAIENEVLTVIMMMKMANINPDRAQTALREIFNGRVQPIRKSLGMDQASIPSRGQEPQGSGYTRAMTS